jgi:DNA-binding LytR/AlgR family response regulator
MPRILPVFLFVLAWLIACSVGAQAAEMITDADEVVTVCPAVDARGPPKFTEPSCRRTRLVEVDLHARAVWISASMELPRPELQQPPTGLFVSARASTRAYVNGVFVGSNGQPALEPANERPGKLDAVFYVPHELLRPGRNSVVLLASGHEPALVRSQALHAIKLAVYRRAPLMVLPRYVPALFTFGAFLVGAMYFGAMAFTRQSDRAALALGAASLLAACQLLAETLRGLWAYPYPVHGLRLTLIVVLTLGVGLALAAHTAERLKVGRAGRLLTIIALAATAGVLLLPGFDAKLDWAALATSAGSAGLAMLAIREQRRAAAQYAAAFTGLTALVLLDPVMFFDVHGFWAFAALLLFLFAREARELREIERRREEAEGRRRQLEAALDRLSPRDAVALVVTSSGRQLRIPADQVAALSGAGDYVELRLMDGRELLHSGSLAALEKALPAMFLRVHRSHIVNLDQIAELIRLPTGGGELRLRSGAIVPVSRRVMPQVRRALNSGDIARRVPVGASP